MVVEELLEGDEISVSNTTDELPRATKNTPGNHSVSNTTDELPRMTKNTRGNHSEVKHTGFL